MLNVCDFSILICSSRIMRFRPNPIAFFVIFSIVPAAFAEDGALMLKLDRSFTRME